MECIFENNTEPMIGQNVTGGAVWTPGRGTATIARSVFKENRRSNWGALDILGRELFIFTSHFARNQVTDNGVNGGAISFDGRGRKNSFCRTRFSGNQLNIYDLSRW